MKEKTKMTLILGGIVLLVIGVTSASFAFLSITRKQDIVNNFTSGCLNISIENESAAITLSNTYPITDVEGLGTTGYTFTIKNTCSTSTNYQINLESLNQTANTLDTQYIKTSLSSDTMDNLIQKLDSNMVTKAYIENAYVSHNLYEGTIEGNSTKEFNLKLWIDYDTTKEQGANKTYTSKINVIANPDLEVAPTPEIKTTLVGNTFLGKINGLKTQLENSKRINITNITNDETYPFNYNEETGVFTSTNKDASTQATMSFKLSQNYKSIGICYSVSTTTDMQGAAFGLDGEPIVASLLTGEESDCIILENVTTENEILAGYIVENVDETDKVKNEVSFYVVEASNVGEISSKYCIADDNKCTPNINSEEKIGNYVNIVQVPANTIATILGNIEVNATTPNKKMVCTTLNNNKIYCSDSMEIEEKKEIPNFSIIATTDEGIYVVSDEMYGGTSYYWRGAVTNNYVKFANFCWRIVRINGDGTIRLIYDGTTCHANGESTTDSIAVSNVAYNTNYNQSNYVGWTYEGKLQRPDNNAIATPSNAKTQLEAWYNENISGTNAQKVAQGKFCNDRDAGSGYTWSNKGGSFYYAALTRSYDRNPVLNCPSGDIYTLSVGLITADEIMYAGGVKKYSGAYEINNSYYLYNGQNYWTMSPGLWSNSSDYGAQFFIMSSDGSFAITNKVSNDHYGLRPVINLRNDIRISSGNGTIDNPYIVAD